MRPLSCLDSQLSLPIEASLNLSLAHTHTHSFSLSFCVNASLWAWLWRGMRPLRFLDSQLSQPKEASYHSLEFVPLVAVSNLPEDFPLDRQLLRVKMVEVSLKTFCMAISP